MANRDFNKIKRTIQDFSLNVGGNGSGAAVKLRTINSHEEYGINYELLIDFMNNNGIDTNLTLSELASTGITDISLPLGTGTYGSSNIITLTIDAGCNNEITISDNMGEFETINLNPGYQTEVPIKELVLNGPKNTTASENGEVFYVFPWFDLTPTE